MAGAGLAEIGDLDGHGASSHKIAPIVRFSFETDLVAIHLREGDA